MFFGVRLFCLVRWWVCGSCVVIFCSVCGVSGGGKSISHLLIGVGLDLCMCGGRCIERKGVSLLVFLLFYLFLVS